MRTALSLIQAILFLVSSLSVIDSNFKERVDWAAIGVSSKTRFSFPTSDADSFAVSDAERQKCRIWFDENVRFADGTHKAPAYDFSVGGQSLRRHTQDWTFDVSAESEIGAVRRGGKTTYITLRHKKSGLTATVEATIYEEYATCEWTVYLQNRADTPSPVISSFSAADCVLPTGQSQLYVSKGSGADANDFELHRSFVNVLPMRFNANGGRTESTLPYFNLCGRTDGVLIAVGWTGQWYTSLSQRIGGVAVCAKQETFRAALEPQETVRSPLVSLTFYTGGNALKGFNLFRAWESDCVYTENACEITTGGLANEFSTETADEMIRNIRAMPDELCAQIDYLWMDAGWYTYTDGWYDGVGNWKPNPDRFPNGLALIAEAAAEKGMGLLLWYEPERCCAGTTVYEDASRHEGWLLRKSDEVNMVNLANNDACTYLGDLVANSIKENQVGLYRQDFNFTPLPLWEQADKDYCGGRKGITENHYVSNLYRYLDRLQEVNPGLIIDNCASGGKRLDLEMSRRSIPLWRNDYNCANDKGEVKSDVLEATQVNTYGLSFWLPLHGTGAYVPGEYADRTCILPCAQKPGYADIRAYLDKNYYPLTYGGLRTDRFLAMQFGDAQEGAALIYKRQDVRSDAYTVRFNGLRPDAMYSVWDYDNADAKTSYLGAKLMGEGLNVTIEEAPKCAIILYSIK